MQLVRKGQARVAARARLMLLLGEQLITDEVAAVSELVKNAYDANATEVVVTISHVSEPGVGCIVIRDNGHGMTLDTVLSSWLELGTLSKARGPDMKPRFTEGNKRLCLGEKGLGRLAVHKLGRVTELVTRRLNANSETKLMLDWSAFEGSEKFLEDIPVEWQETEPTVFTRPGFTHGTAITITRLQRRWTRGMIERVQRSLYAMKSPFAELADFDIIVDIDDKEAAELEVPDLAKLVTDATYRFTDQVDETGEIRYQYRFHRSDLAELSREKRGTKDIRSPDDFPGERKPVCGPFRIRLYSWDLAPQDQRAVLGDTSTYKEMIQPNSGVKVFRDGFRVLPYGNVDNDWLSMDMERVRQFELRLSRNQVLGAIEISAETNPYLIDKSDREGLIDNDAFRDFLSLVKSALADFEAERYIDRRKLKEATGRIRDRETDQTIFVRNMAFLSKAIADQPKLDSETKREIQKLLSESRQAFDSVLVEREQPLLVAATIGLTYMMPTHEVRRDLHEALKILRRMRDDKVPSEQVSSAISLLKQADSTVGGIGRLMQRSREDEVFRPERAAKNAIELMRYRLARNAITYEIDVRNSMEVIGSDRLTTVVLLNFLDNSIYWLLRKRPEERKIKVVVDLHDSGCLLAVSDNGPGFGDDDIQTVTLPFFTRKPDGMGLGLYIADRIARSMRARLVIPTERDLPGLLPGATIGVIFQRTER